MIYFGYPNARKNDPGRAVFAGFGILGALRQKNSHLQTEKGIKRTARVGIHTSLVLATEVQAMVDEIPSLTTQLQILAASDARVISRVT